MNPSLSAHAFNTLAARRRANRLIEVRYESGGGWVHPWQISLRYSGVEGWQASIQPGFVNGLAATVPLEKAETLLTKRPVWTLNHFRDIGPAASPISLGTSGDNITASFEAVPKFFSYLGVGKPPVIGTDGLNAIQSGTDAQRRTERLLKAIDLVLYQDHPATLGNVQITNPASGNIVTVDAVYVDSSQHKRRPYLRQTARYVPPLPNADAFTAALNGWQDAARTELHLATIYFVSPPGTGNAAPLDQTWAPYVQHRVFWNLNHDTNVVGQPLNTDPIRLSVPLAAGIGQPLIDALLAQVNDATSTISQFLSNQRIVGKFWSI
jgi:hypothetical protein